MALSRTALVVTVERWEIEELIDRLLEKKCQAADKEDYTDAQHYKRRVEELRAILKTPLPGPDSAGDEHGS